MKRFFIFISLVLALVNISYAQNNVTKFMGIPVDGSKVEVVRQLLDKGFEYDDSQDNWTRLTGFFNGVNSHIYVTTNKNLVDRIYVCDKNTCSESEIIIRFNKLVRQFANNDNYISDGYEKYLIPQNEYISYEMLCYNKNYDAIFYQKADTININEYINTLNNISDEEINEMVSYLIKSDALCSNLYPTFDLEYFNNRKGTNLDNKNKGFLITVAELSNLKINFDKYKRPVWFRICKDGNGYYIAIFYDNEHNRAQGEDL